MLSAGAAARTLARVKHRTLSAKEEAMAASDQRTARIVGWLFVGTFVFSIPGWLLYGPLLNHHDYILGGGHDRDEPQSHPQLLLTVPEIIGEASLGVYLVARGFKAAPILRDTGERVAAAPVPALG